MRETERGRDFENGSHARPFFFSLTSSTKIKPTKGKICQRLDSIAREDEQALETVKTNCADPPRPGAGCSIFDRGCGVDDLHHVCIASALPRLTDSPFRPSASSAPHSNHLMQSQGGDGKLAGENGISDAPSIESPAAWNDRCLHLDACHSADALVQARAPLPGIDTWVVGRPTEGLSGAL